MGLRHWLQDGNTRKPMAQALNRNSIQEGGPPRMSSREYMRKYIQGKTQFPHDKAADCAWFTSPKIRLQMCTPYMILGFGLSHIHLQFVRLGPSQDLLSWHLIDQACCKPMWSFDKQHTWSWMASMLSNATQSLIMMFHKHLTGCYMLHLVVYICMPREEV